MSMIELHLRIDSLNGRGWSPWLTGVTTTSTDPLVELLRLNSRVALDSEGYIIEYRLPTPKPPTPAEALEALGLDPQGRPKERVTHWTGGDGLNIKWAHVEDLPPAPPRPVDTSTAYWRRKWADAEARTVMTSEKAVRAFGATPERIRRALAVLDRVEALELPPKKLNHASPYSHGYHDGQRSLYRQITSNERDRA